MEILNVVKPDSDELEVVFYEFINLPDGSCLQEKEHLFPVDELINEAVSRAKKRTY